MRSLVTLLFILFGSNGLSQDFILRDLNLFEGSETGMGTVTHLGNGCFLTRSSNGEDLLSINGTLWSLSDFLSFDEVEAAIWLDMTGDNEEELILETSTLSGRSSYGGGFREEMEFVAILDVVKAKVLFSFDYFVELESWSNEVDWNEDSDDEPEITDSSGYHEVYSYLPFYTKGQVLFFKQFESSIDEPILMEGEELYIYRWKGASFQEEFTLSSSKQLN